MIEHSGQDTFPTSLQICDHSGMIVTVGGTSGYNCDFDVRHLWIHQKRIQGSHYANIRECGEFLHLVNQELMDGKLHGNAAILVNAPSAGLGAITEKAQRINVAKPQAPTI